MEAKIFLFWTIIKIIHQFFFVFFLKKNTVVKIEVEGHPDRPHPQPEKHRSKHTGETGAPR